MLQGLAGTVLFVLHIAAMLVGLYAFVHAAMQRPDAYTAADKLTKPIWLAIIGGCGLLGLVFGPGFGTAVIACAAGVYLVDVRPKILEIQGKSR
jgi:hypothetical protein